MVWKTYKVGRLVKQDDSDTIPNLIVIIVFIVVVVAIIALIVTFIRNIRSILLDIILVGSLIKSLWLYMVVGFYCLYGVSFLDYLSGCYGLFSFSACYSHSLQLLPAIMQYSPIYSITKLLAHFNIEITSKIIISFVWVCIGLYFLLLQAFCTLAFY